MPLFDHISKIDVQQPLTIIPGTSQTLPKIQPMKEIGVTGLLRTSGVGYVFEEWLAALSTYRAKQVYREMRDNDAVINAMFFALEMILRKADWIVKPAEKRAKGQFTADFIEECMEDMSHTWSDFICENLNMFAFGFSLFETVYKRRKGPDGRKASRFDDGLIGWRKFAPRAQESILYWMWDDEGGLQGAVQLAAPNYRTVPIPIEKLLLFRTTSLKNNPEGRSILRGSFRSWFFKRRIEEIEGIGIERDLCGIPVLYATAEALLAMGGMEVARQLVTNIRIDDQMGVVIPMAYDEKGNPLVKLELMKTAGAKQTDPGGAIQRYNQDMLNTMLAGFIQLGQTPTGSFSLHLSASQIFEHAIAAYMESTADVMNRIAIPRLMTLNNMDLEDAPKLVPGELGKRDLDSLGGWIQKLSMAGLTFIDPKTQNYLRKVSDIPELDEDDPAFQPPPAPVPPGAVDHMGKPILSPPPNRQAPPGNNPPSGNNPPGAAPPKAAPSWGGKVPKGNPSAPPKPAA